MATTGNFISHICFCISLDRYTGQDSHCYSDMTHPTRLQSAFNLFEPSTKAVLRSPGAYFIFYVIPFILFTAASAIDIETQRTDYVTSLAFATFVSLLLYPPLVYTYLRSAHGKTVSVLDAVRKSYRSFWPLLGLTLITGFIILIGLLLFIVPGVIMLRRYLLSPYYLIEEKLSIKDAMTRSAEESKVYQGSVYGVIGVILLIALIGVVTQVGLVVSAILQLLYAAAPAIRYLEIKKALKD